MFFVVSKILYFIIQPLNVALAILFVGWLTLFKRSKLGRHLVGSGLIVLYAFAWGPISGALIIPLEKRFSNSKITEPIDGIIVLGGGFRTLESGTVQFGNLDRTIKGIILARQHHEATLVFSGGSASVLNQTHREADYMTKLSELFGISSDRVLIDRNSRNTRENAIETANLLKDYRQNNANAKWVLITSAFHMPRAVGCFRMVGIDPIPYKVDYIRDGNYNFIPLPSPENLMESRIAIKEWIGLIAYKLAGYTDEFFPE